MAFTHTACTLGGVMQPGAGTTVERQVAGEFGDRSPVLNQTKPKPLLPAVLGGTPSLARVPSFQRPSARFWRSCLPFGLPRPMVLCTP